ncbi:MAG: tetratricopeptide repeat protein, partial [Candidatus Omnitrophica bacterium]|nr:tetratricopeptide repeat protein [Candidatus Omnitrophota bacterium]
MAIQKKILKQKVSLILFGIIIFFIILETGLWVGRFVCVSVQEHRNIISIKKKGAYRILCLGESTTAVRGSNSYPGQLEQILNQANIGIEFSVINKGMIGIGTGTIVKQLEDNLNIYNPDMVITMMGINDGREDIMSYDDSNYCTALKFVRRLKTYKLLRLIWLHGIAKAEAGDEELQELVMKRHFDEVKVYKSQKNYEKIEEILKKILQMDSKKIDAWSQLGWCYREQKRYEEAEKTLKKALVINPDRADSYIQLGWCYHEQ